MGWRYSMKKFLTICVGLILCFALTACNNSASGTQNGGIFGSTSRETLYRESSWAINMSVGTSEEEPRAYFTIYLDENKIITDFYCEDEMAEEIVKKADVKGKNIEEGYVTLLDAGCALGYYNAEALLGVHIEKDLECIDAEFAEWTADYVQESKNYFSFSMGVRKEYTGELVYITKDSSGVFWISTYVFENGVLKLQQGVATDGATSETRWEAENVCSYSINKRANGDFSETFYENGQVVKEIMHQIDGLHMEQFYENGQIVRSTSVDDKNERETLYENGKIKHHVQKGTDGTYYETVYGANEETLESHEIDADGNKFDKTYYANGNRKEENYVYADNRVQKHQYYENGKNMYSYMKEADGTVREWKYNENGVNVYYYEKLPNGSYTKQTWDAAGNLIGEESENFAKTCTYQDGKLVKETYKDSEQSSETYYDADGNVTKVITNDRNGKSTAIYAPNNILKESEFIRVDGLYTKTKYNENGVCIYRYIKETDGSVLIQYFDDNGNLVKQERG